MIYLPSWIINDEIKTETQNNINGRLQNDQCFRFSSQAAVQLTEIYCISRFDGNILAIKYRKVSDKFDCFIQIQSFQSVANT